MQLVNPMYSNQSNNQDNETNQNDTNSDKIIVYTSFHPLYDFASKIGGEHIEVINLLLTGAEPHDFEPTARDIINLNRANAFFYNGGEFETCAYTLGFTIPFFLMFFFN